MYRRSSYQVVTVDDNINCRLITAAISGTTSYYTSDYHNFSEN